MTTRTHAVLSVSRAAYDEIYYALKLAGHDGQVKPGIIDMRDIVLVPRGSECPQCRATRVVCEDCGAEWCLDHQPNPLVCPGCGRRLTSVH